MKKKLLRILSKSHAVEILESLSKEPSRFVDLKNICKSNRTRAMRLRELKSEELIKAVPKIAGERAYTFYEITPLGKKALKLVESIIRLTNDREKNPQHE